MEPFEIKQFRTALESGDRSRVQDLLATSPLVQKAINDPIGAFGSRPVQIAAKHRELLDLLIDHGADINLRSDWEKGPYSVLDSCDEATARHLLTRGATLTAHAASRFGWFDELVQIVDADPQAVHALGGDGQRPLHHAKTIDIVDFLLARGAQIDARCIDHHSTAAQYALVERPEICRHLLSRGATPDIFMPAALGDEVLAEKLIDADPNCLSARVHFDGYPLVPPFNIYCWTLGWYRSPAIVAQKFGHQALYELMMRQSPPTTKLFAAISQSDLKLAEQIIGEHPTMFSTFTRQDQQMLAVAAQHGLDEAVLMSLKLGFDLHAPGPEGQTPLHAAAWSGSARIVEALLAIDHADLNRIEPQFNATPLGWARHGSEHCGRDGANHEKVIELLTAAGAR